MLLALTAQEGQDLQDRAAMLQQNGIRAAYHSQAAVTELEPALQLPHSGGALLVESDAQLVRHPIISSSLGYSKHHSPTPLCHSHAALMLL
jgi:L-2-hydroxyglutarate oxidase LhgO